MDYVFDLDGTLVHPGDSMHQEFWYWLLRFIRTRVHCGDRFYVLSGNTRQHACASLGETLINELTGVFCDLGNTRWVKHTCVHSHNHEWSSGLISSLNRLASSSGYANKTGCHVRASGGVLQFSVPGVDVHSDLEKQRYQRYDSASCERLHMVQHINQMFPEVEAVLSGRSTIQIVEKGKTKKQVMHLLRTPCVYFGDEIKPHHNDYDVAQSIHAAHSKNEIFPVTDWRETWEILKTFT